MSDREHDLDGIVASIRTSLPEPAAEAAAADRTRRALGLETASAEAAVESARIERCAGFRARNPAFLDSTLPEAEALLLEDHTRDCIPCRRALIAARALRDGPAPAVAKHHRREPWREDRKRARWRGVAYRASSSHTPMVPVGTPSGCQSHARSWGILTPA